MKNALRKIIPKIHEYVLEYYIFLNSPIIAPIVLANILLKSTTMALVVYDICIFRNLQFYHL